MQKRVETAGAARQRNGRLSVIGWPLAAVLMLASCGSHASRSVTQADVEAWTAVWQKREGLQNWKISVRIVRRAELPPGVVGDVYWRNDWLDRRPSADIRVLCAEDLEGLFGETPAVARRESEETVVHELMHLVLSPLEIRNSPVQKREVEVLTETFARMLFRRRVPGGEPEAQFIDAKIDGLRFKPSPKVKEQVMLQLVRAMDAVSEDDVVALVRNDSSRRPW